MTVSLTIAERLTLFGMLPTKGGRLVMIAVDAFAKTLEQSLRESGAVDDEGRVTIDPKNTDEAEIVLDDMMASVVRDEFARLEKEQLFERGHLSLYSKLF